MKNINLNENSSKSKSKIEVNLIDNKPFDENYVKSTQEDKEDDQIISNLRNKIEKIPQSITDLKNQSQKKYNFKNRTENQTENLKKIKSTENKKRLPKLDFKTQEMKRKRSDKKFMLDIKSNIKNSISNHDNENYKIILKCNE